MGAWDVGSFENDDAMDWVYELEEETSLSFLADALENIIDQKGGYPEAPECTIAICAAEVVAALLGSPDDDLPDEVNEWVDDKPEPSDVLVEMANSALDLVMAGSELKDLWAESDEYREWQRIIKNLQSRLQTE